MIDIKKKLFSFTNAGNPRSALAKKNIMLMLLYKGGNILLGLLSVPLGMSYVNADTYGIWLTLSTIVAWMSFFDIGLSNGLKNCLCESLACGDICLGRKLTSTTYAVLSLIFIPLMILSLAIIPYMNWNNILNLKEVDVHELQISLGIIVVYFCLNTIFSTLFIIITAMQRPADAALRSVVQQILSITVIFILTLTTKGRLSLLCAAYCVTQLIVCIVFNIIVFRTSRYADIAPRIKYVDFKVVPKLMNLGVQFFIIQIAVIVQYQMTNFLIMRYYGATDVVRYNIAYKYFNVLAMIWGIMITPIWVAVTDAIAKGDYRWISDIKRKYLSLLHIFACIGILMLLASSTVYKLWIGDKVTVAVEISAVVLLYTIVRMFGDIFVSIINGSGQIRIQTYASIISPCIFIGTFYLCTHVWCLGVISVILAAIISNFNGLLIAPLQCRKILKSHGV